MSSARTKSLFGGLGTASAASSLLFMKCPLCWLAMGTTVASAYWPIFALPALLAIAFRLRKRVPCGTSTPTIEEKG